VLEEILVAAVVEQEVNLMVGYKDLAVVVVQV
jgi:hypothetical protein